MDEEVNNNGDVEEEHSSESVQQVENKVYNYKCEYCQLTFRKHAKYIRHLVTHTKERPFHCDFPGCNKAFGRKDHLTRHLMSHNEGFPFSCTVEGCNKKYMLFKTSCNLSRHLKWHSKNGANTLSYRCPKCNESFTKKTQLRKHIYMHTGVKPFNCNYPGCDRGFMSSMALKKHEEFHKRNAMFLCIKDHCNYSTESMEEYIDHMKRMHAIVNSKDRHEEGNRIPCPIKGCDYSFASKQTLQNHIDSVHNHLKYRCSVCGKIYSRMASLSRHKHVHSIPVEQQEHDRVMKSITGRVPTKEDEETSRSVEKIQRDLPIQNLPVVPTEEEDHPFSLLDHLTFQVEATSNCYEEEESNMSEDIISSSGEEYD